MNRDLGAQIKHSAVLMNAEIPPSAIARERRSFSFATPAVVYVLLAFSALGQNSLMNFPVHILLSEKCT